MKNFVAVLMGFFSGIMVCIMAAMLFMDFTKPPESPLVITFIFFAAWALSASVIRKNAVSVSKIFSRGFLIGSAEWLSMIAVGAIYAGKITSTVSHQAGGASAVTAGAAIGSGIFSILTGGLSIAMAIVCLIGFAISFSLGREMKPEMPSYDDSKKCPSCAEWVKKEAIKCRHCGEVLN